MFKELVISEMDQVRPLCPSCKCHYKRLFTCETCSTRGCDKCYFFSISGVFCPPCNESVIKTLQTLKHYENFPMKRR